MEETYLGSDHKTLSDSTIGNIYNYLLWDMIGYNNLLCNTISHNDLLEIFHSRLL